MMMKPSPADINLAIRMAELGGWLDPSDYPSGELWRCELIDPNGESERYHAGYARTAEEAMARAWLIYWAPDALWQAHVEPASVPHIIADDWCFELTPPSRGKHWH
jgi:hypothetical protein